MDEYGSYADAWQPDNETAIRFGCIRIQDGTHDTTDPAKTRNPGLYLHTNSAHISVGVTDVWIEPATGYLRVDTDGAVNGVPLVTGDETAAAQGLIFGASGGNGHIDIKCYKVGTGLLDLGDQSDYDVAASGNLNLWIGWLSPLVRGTGGASLADRIADLETRVTALEGATASRAGPRMASARG